MSANCRNASCARPQAARTVSCTWVGSGSPVEFVARQGLDLPDDGTRTSGDRVAFSVADGPEASDRLVAALPHARVLVGEPGEDAKDLYDRVGLDRFLEQLASAPTAEPRGERQDVRSHAG